MRATVRDTDRDPAVVRNTHRFVHLRLTVCRFGNNTIAHMYTPAQARRLAAALVRSAKEAERNRRNAR